jgi:hypothetical protein
VVVRTAMKTDLDTLRAFFRRAPSWLISAWNLLPLNLAK